jgi:hypothetical protein
LPASTSRPVRLAAQATSVLPPVRQHTGNNASKPALYLNNIATPDTTSITGTTFGGTGFNSGIRLEASSDFIFSDGSVSGSHITLASGNGIGNATSRAIYLENTSRTPLIVSPRLRCLHPIYLENTSRTPARLILENILPAKTNNQWSKNNRC